MVYMYMYGDVCIAELFLESQVNVYFYTYIEIGH
jgi:hypothetical protein